MCYFSLVEARASAIGPCDRASGRENCFMRFPLQTIRLWTVFCLSLIEPTPLRAESFVAFNDFAPGLGTHSNTTSFGPSQAGLLRNIATGQKLSITLSVSANGFTAGGVQGHPAYGTPASVIFDGFVDFAGGPSPGIELSSTTNRVTYTFSGLDPNLEYNFQGSAVRGHFAYSNRWTLVELTGAASFTSRHSGVVLTRSQTSDLKPIRLRSMLATTMRARWFPGSTLNPRQRASSR